MRIEWLHKKPEGRVILFFNGWGMDAAVVAHLKTESSVAMVYDFRSLEGILPDLTGFQEVNIVAWSMGVWAAANVLSCYPSLSYKAIALNGTEHPVHDEWGIPEKIYRLTEQGMSQQGLKKFIRRMLNGVEEMERFEARLSTRGLPELCEELTLIRKQSAVLQNEICWEKVYVAEKDIIFPFPNQWAWWQTKTKTEILSGGHYPFYHFQTWEEILGESDD